MMEDQFRWKAKRHIRKMAMTKQLINSITLLGLLAGWKWEPLPTCPVVSIKLSKANEKTADDNSQKQQYQQPEKQQLMAIY